MIKAIRQSLRSQFGAAIDMLENAVNSCPDSLFQTTPRFFYNAYHCIILLDYYLSVPPPAEFIAELPFSIQEPENIPKEALGDMVPDRIYTKPELLLYISNCRNKCHELIDGLTESSIAARWVEASGEMDYALLEIMLYNLRHVQHHAAQLNMMLRQAGNKSPGWVFREGEG